MPEINAQCGKSGHARQTQGASFVPGAIAGLVQRQGALGGSFVAAMGP